MSTLCLMIQTQQLLPICFEVSVGGGGGGELRPMLSPWHDRRYGASALERRTLMKVNAVLKGGRRPTCLDGSIDTNSVQLYSFELLRARALLVSCRTARSSLATDACQSFKISIMYLGNNSATIHPLCDHDVKHDVNHHDNHVRV